jgi:hypothetical protein
VIKWLTRYSVFMGLKRQARYSIARKIIAFANERTDKSLQLNEDRIIQEFVKLSDCIHPVVPPNRTGRTRAISSLASKALWCCYPEDVPILDRNAIRALGVISRLFHLAPRRLESEYARFVDVWLQVYGQIESEIQPCHLSSCRFKVRVLDMILWHLGADGFYCQRSDQDGVADRDLRTPTAKAGVAV